MPLSDHEQKMLDAMERALYAEDPKFATQMKGRTAGAPSRRRLAIGVVGAIAGLALVVLGVWSQLVLVGVLGFLLMVGGVAYGFAPMRAAASTSAQTGAAATARPAKAKKAAKPSDGFMKRMEDRWDKRREQP